MQYFMIISATDNSVLSASVCHDDVDGPPPVGAGETAIEVKSEDYLRYRAEVLEVKRPRKMLVQIDPTGGVEHAFTVIDFTPPPAAHKEFNIAAGGIETAVIAPLPIPCQAAIKGEAGLVEVTAGVLEISAAEPCDIEIAVFYEGKKFGEYVVHAD